MSNALKSGGLLSLLLATLAVLGLMTAGITAEVPIGSAKGRIIMASNQLGLPNADVVFVRYSNDAYEGKSEWVAETDKDGNFEVKPLPAGTYVMSVYGKVHRIERQVVQIREGKLTQVEGTAERSTPYLSMRAADRVFLPGELVEVQIEGLSDVDTIQFRVSEVSGSLVDQSNGIDAALRSLVSARNQVNPAETKGLVEVKKEERPLKAKDIEGVFVERHELGTYPPGLYLVEASDKQFQSFAYFMVTDIGMVTKVARGAGIAYVTNLKSGVPVADASVDLITPSGRKALGKTNADGIVELSAAGNPQGSLLISAQKEGSRAVTSFWYSGVERDAPVIDVVSDRPVYRPGDTIRYKATIRLREEGKYRLPEPGLATVEVRNTLGDVIATESKALDEWGVLSGEIATVEEAGPGWASIEIRYAGAEESESFAVSEYRKPYFEVKVEPVRESYTKGDRVMFTVKATTFTGEPVVGADIEANLSESWAYTGSPFDDEADEYWGDDSDWPGDYVKSFQSRTNERGEATISFATTGPRVTIGQEFSDSRLTLEASVSDPSGRYFSGKGNVMLYRGDGEIFAEFDRYNLSGPGHEAILKIDTNTTRANGDVEVELTREQFTETTMVPIAESKQTVRLDAEGKATLSIKPKKSGSYLARVSFVDARQNLVATQAYIWVSGTTEEEYGRRSDLQLIPDKRRYEQSDTAEVLVRTGNPGGKALVTIEGEKLFQHQMVDLASGEALIRVPLQARYAPNVQVSVARIHGKEFSESSRTLRIGLAPQTLPITVTPSSTEAKPGEMIDVEINTGVAAEVALGVVDEGIYQVMEDTDDPMDTFYPRGYSEVVTSYSFPDIYLDGEGKGDAKSEIRKDFRDTAFWNPTVRTDETGRASVRLKLPDNLTKWRLTATGTDRSTRVGKTTASVVAEKELMARLSLPAFLVQNDQQVVTASVANSTDQDLDVQVAWELGRGLSSKSALKQTIKIAANSTQSVSVELVASAFGEGIVRFTAVSGAFQDGLEMTVPIAARAIKVPVAYSRTLEPGKAVDLEIRRDEKAVAGKFRLNLSPSLNAGLPAALPELVDYPYGCVEQTMSRFVPAVLVRQYMRENGISDPALDAKIDEVTEQSLARIRMLKGSDGWGWFEYGEPIPEMTAIVLEGLRVAELAGVKVPDDLTQEALSASRRMLEKPVGSDRQYPVSLAFALLRRETSENAVKVLQLASAQTNLSVTDQAHIALGLHLSGDPKVKRLSQKMLSDMKRRASAGSETVSYGDPLDTAAALETLIAMEPDSDWITKLLLSLNQERRGRGWGDTWRTHMAIRAQLSVTSLRQIESAQGSVTVLLNGNPVGTYEMAPLAASTEITLDWEQMKPGKNVVSLRFAGTGQAFATLDGEQRVYAQESAPIRRPGSFSLKREFFPMESVRLEDGSLRYQVGKSSRTSFRSGEVFRVRLTIKSDVAMSYVAIEDPLPSNMRIVDADKPEPGFDWTNWWSNSTFFDDKATFFMDTLPAGESVLEYAVRAEATGVGTALPAQAYPMYQRDILATSSQLRLEVRP